MLNPKKDLQSYFLGLLISIVLSLALALALALALSHALVLALALALTDNKNNENPLLHSLYYKSKETIPRYSLNNKNPKARLLAFLVLALALSLDRVHALAPALTYNMNEGKPLFYFLLYEDTKEHSYVFDLS